jgi:hypothetical protein
MQVRQFGVPENLIILTCKVCGNPCGIVPADLFQESEREIRLVSDCCGGTVLSYDRPLMRGELRHYYEFQESLSVRDWE